MEAARWDRFERIFERACTLSPDQREAYVDEICGEDKALRDELRSLLACAEAAPTFFESPAGAVPAPELPEAPRPDPAGDPYRLIGRTVSRYRVEALLGGGGMGVVYRAVDDRLRRTVALKFLPPQWRSDEVAKQRLIREAQAASALDHPNIASVYEVDETEEGQLYIAMRCYEGETLEPKLDRGPLPLDEALDYAAQVACGLAAAHAQGIVHRDIKPANIIITDEGVVKLVDFGLAKLAGGTQLTEVGVTMGTVAYMSPEQARGEAVDHRTDLWSLGVVLYEMLTGERPFRGVYEQAVLYGILHEAPESLIAHCPDLPPGLVGIVERLLRKDPDDRPSSAAALLEDLERLRQGAPIEAPPRPKQRRAVLSRPRVLASVGVSLLLVALLLTWALPESRQAVARWLGTAAAPAEKHLAVLPFTATGEASPNEAFSEGLMLTLTSLVGQMSQFSEEVLTVVPASEMAEIASAREARRRFGVRFAITGNVLQEADRVRLILSLVDAERAVQLETATVEAGQADVAALQAGMVEALAQLLSVSLTPEARHLLTAGTTADARAYALYQEGLGFLRRPDKPENIDTAIRSFTWALQEDSLFALAYAGLSQAYWLKYETGRDTQYVRLGKQYGERAITLEDRLPTVYETLGTIYRATGEYEQALREFQAALLLDPNSVPAYRGLAATYEALGRWEQAETHYLKAIELQPKYWANYNNLGVFYLMGGRYVEAAEQFKEVTGLAPDNFWGYNNLGATYLSLERWTEAREMFERALEIKSNYQAYLLLGYVYYSEAQYEEEARMYERALALDSTDYAVWENLASAYSRMQEEPKAQEAYQRAARLAEVKLSVNPNDAVLLGDLADYYSHLGQPAQARAFIQKALDLSPKDVELLAEAGRIFERLGDREAALRFFREAVEKGFPVERLERDPELFELREDDRYRRWFDDKIDAVRE